MPEVYDYDDDVPLTTREVPVTREVIVRRSSPGALFLMFILGLICAGAIVAGLATAMGVQTASNPWRVSWPAGQVQLNQSPSPHLVFQRGQTPNLPNG